VPPQLFTIGTLGLFFELSMGLSARKEIPGMSWYLRINPSSGNLHPTEVMPSCWSSMVPGAVFITTRRWNTPWNNGTSIIWWRVSRRRILCWPDLHRLARGMEVWRTGLPLIAA